MRGRAVVCIRTFFVAGAIAGLGACQTQSQAPSLAATVTPTAAGGMDGDIRRILTQGGLSASAPGSLQTNKMPADVQQAVAALQGGAPAPVPFGGGAAGVAPVGVQSMPQAGGSMIAALPTASPGGGIPANALALAPTQQSSPFPPAQQPPLLAALAQTQAAHARTASRRPAPSFNLAPAPAARSAPPAVVVAQAPPQLVFAAAPVPVTVSVPKAPEPPPVRRF